MAARARTERTPAISKRDEVGLKRKLREANEGMNVLDDDEKQ